MYYLSWGCYYAMAESIYGSFDCHGSIVLEERVCPRLHYHGDRNIDWDRHGSFFEWHGQWYYICNEMGLTQNVGFRDSSISYVHYRDNGQIEPVYITDEGVSLP